jgi:hypothetical protein
VRDKAGLATPVNKLSSFLAKRSRYRFNDNCATAGCPTMQKPANWRAFFRSGLAHAICVVRADI